MAPAARKDDGPCVWGGRLPRWPLRNRPQT